VRYRARVQYDGTEFAGFQAQPGRRTVQGVLERALAHLVGGQRIPISAAGRTDAGVHATGQVIAFLDFDPRRAAIRREYRYTIWNGPRNPLRERFAYPLEDRLDVDSMQRAAAALVGQHDFTAFGRVKTRSVRTLYEVRLRRHGHLVTIDVVGDAFLHQMVRSIVAGLIRVGLGRATSEDLVRESRGPGRAFDGAVVPPCGLCLRRVVIGSPRKRQGMKEQRQGHE
jgi:tRNA pseudouridine38-40 synthase